MGAVLLNIGLTEVVREVYDEAYPGIWPPADAIQHWERCFWLYIPLPFFWALAMQLVQPTCRWKWFMRAFILLAGMAFLFGMGYVALSCVICIPGPGIWCVEIG